MSGNLPVQRPSDEILLAYADGALAADQRAAVESYLAGDPEARDLVELLRSSGTLTAQAYAHIIDEPVPERLVATVKGTPGHARADVDGGNIVSLADERARRWRMRPLIASLAATLLLTLGTATGYFVALRQQPLDGAAIAIGPLPSTSPIARLLETESSHVPIPFPASASSPSVEAMVVATLRDKSQRYCRELEVISHGADGKSAGSVIGAVACRTGQGEWVVEGAVHVAAESGGASTYNPASGAAHAPFDGLVSYLGATASLPADEEARLIARGWTATP